MRGATQATAAGLRRPSPRADCRIADFSAFIGFAGIFPALPPRSGAAAVQDTDAQSIRRYCISQIVSAIINPSRRWMTVRRPHRLQAQKKYRSQAQAGEKGIGSQRGRAWRIRFFCSSVPDSVTGPGHRPEAAAPPAAPLPAIAMPLRPSEINSSSFHHRVIVRGCASAAASFRLIF